MDKDGVVGTLFYPGDGEAHPVVICLSGSGGGLNEPRASLLASQGYTAFALGYFGCTGLPKELVEIPLEFFGQAITLLKKHKSADCSRIAVYGYSKGGELALLLASIYREVKAVAAFSGSSFVWMGLHQGRPESSWTRNGEPLPYLPMKVPFRTIIDLFRGKKVAFRQSYIRGMKSSSKIKDAEIPVENINGPVFLVAGTDDQVWPAADFCDIVVKRLDKHKSTHPTEYLEEEGAGHLVGMPYLPSAEFKEKLIFTSSNIELSSKAVIKAWQAMLNFFKQNL